MKDLDWSDVVRDGEAAADAQYPKFEVAPTVDRLRREDPGAVDVTMYHNENQASVWTLSEGQAADLCAALQRHLDGPAPVRSADKYVVGLVADVFDRYGVSQVDLAVLPDLITELAAMVEDVSNETAEMALANVTDPSSPAYGLGVRG